MAKGMRECGQSRERQRRQTAKKKGERSPFLAHAKGQEGTGGDEPPKQPKHGQFGQSLLGEGGGGASSSHKNFGPRAKDGLTTPLIVEGLNIPALLHMGPNSGLIHGQIGRVL